MVTCPLYLPAKSKNDGPYVKIAGACVESETEYLTGNVNSGSNSARSLSHIMLARDIYQLQFAAIERWLTVWFHLFLAAGFFQLFYPAMTNNFVFQTPL